MTGVQTCALPISFSQIGFVMTCQYIAGAVANVPGGVLVDTVGRKGLLMAVSLFWVGFPYLLMSFTHSYLMLLACVAMVGVGNSLWHPTAIPTLAQRFPDRKGLVLSLHGMGGNAGDAVAPLVVGALLAVFSWREVVVLNVLPGLVVAFVLLLFLGSLSLGRKPGAAADDAPQSLAEYARVLRHRAEGAAGGQQHQAAVAKELAQAASVLGQRLRRIVDDSRSLAAELQRAKHDQQQQRDHQPRHHVEHHHLAP